MRVGHDLAAIHHGVLLRPLEMHRSGTSPYQYWHEEHVAPTFFGSAPGGPPTSSDARDSNVAMPHGWDDQDEAVVLPWQSYDSAAAAGAIVSNVLEMANWLTLNVNEGCYAGRQLLSQQTMRELHAAQNAYVNDAQFPFAVTDGAMRGAGEYRRIEASPTWTWRRRSASLRISLSCRRAGSGHRKDRTGSRAPAIGSGLKLSLHKAVAMCVLDRLLGVPAQDWSKEFMPGSR